MYVATVLPYNKDSQSEENLNVETIFHTWTKLKL